MPTTKLTIRNIDALPAASRDTFYWDADLSGFGVKVTAAGLKTFLVQYRMGGRGTKTRRYTIGKHGVWTPATARAEAERVLRLAATGTDPQAAEQERERLERELGFTPYMERFLREHGQRKWRPRTFKSADSNARRWILPVLGRKSLTNITRRDITEVLDRLPATSPALPRNLFALLRKVFAWSVERGDLERSPTDGMTSPEAVSSRDRVLDDHELRLVVMMAGDLRTPFGAFVRLLLVTGQRRNEIADMCWSELDRANALWTIPKSRTKNKQLHRVPLNRIAVAELDALAAGERWPAKGLVFTTTGSTPISGFSGMKGQLDALLTRANRGIPLEPWRLHDLRRTFATRMQPLGVRFEVTEALLNHISGSKSGVAGVYQRHEWALEKAEAVELWADKLSELIGRGSAG